MCLLADRFHHIQQKAESLSRTAKSIGLEINISKTKSVHIINAQQNSPNWPHPETSCDQHH